jgi:tetratricopeptide (TPR) repeat protein
LEGEGDHDRAIADFSRVIELNPQDARAFYSRGIALLHKGDRDRAIADYTKAVEISPEFIEAYVSRGIVYQAGGDRDHAIADYSKAIEINPQHSNAYLNRGNVSRPGAIRTVRSRITTRSSRSIRAIPPHTFAVDLLIASRAMATSLSRILTR